MTTPDASPASNEAAPQPAAQNGELFSADGLTGSRKVALLAAEFHFKTPEGKMLAVARQKVWSTKHDFRITSPGNDEELLAVTSRTFFRPNVYDVKLPDGESCGTLRRRRTTGFFEQPPWEVVSTDQRDLADVEQQGKVIKIRDGDKVLGIASISLGGSFEMVFTPDTQEQLPRPLGVAALLVMMAIHHGVVS